MSEKNLDVVPSVWCLQNMDLTEYCLMCVYIYIYIRRVTTLAHIYTYIYIYVNMCTYNI